MKTWMLRCLKGETGVIVPAASREAPQAVETPWDAGANFAVLRGPLEEELGLIADALNGLTLRQGEKATEFSAVRTTNAPADADLPALGTVHYGVGLMGAVSGFFRVELADRGFVVRYEVVGRAYDVVVIPLSSEPIVALREALGAFLRHVGEALEARGFVLSLASG